MEDNKIRNAMGLDSKFDNTDTGGHEDLLGSGKYRTNPQYLHEAVKAKANPTYRGGLDAGKFKRNPLGEVPNPRKSKFKEVSSLNELVDFYSNNDFFTDNEREDIKNDAKYRNMVNVFHKNYLNKNPNSEKYDEYARFGPAARDVLDMMNKGHIWDKFSPENAKAYQKVIGPYYKEKFNYDIKDINDPRFIEDIIENHDGSLKSYTDAIADWYDSKRSKPVQDKATVAKPAPAAPVKEKEEVPKQPAPKNYDKYEKFLRAQLGDDFYDNKFKGASEEIKDKVVEMISKGRKF